MFEITPALLHDIAKSLSEINDGIVYQVTKELAEVFVIQAADIAVYTKPKLTRKDGTRELSMTYGWRVEGEDRDTEPTDQERVILAHRLVAGAILILNGAKVINSQ